MIYTGFHDPIAPKDPKKKPSPWTFNAPPYDQRSGCFVEAGDDHGVGFKQPVGSMDHKKQNVIPKGRVKGRNVDYVNRGPSYQIDITDDGY